MGKDPFNNQVEWILMDKPIMDTGGLSSFLFLLLLLFFKFKCSKI